MSKSFSEIPLFLIYFAYKIFHQIPDTELCPKPVKRYICSLKPFKLLNRQRQGTVTNYKPVKNTKGQLRYEVVSLFSQVIPHLDNVK